MKWLGHHSAAFTLDTYVHLLSDDIGEPIDLAVEFGQGGNGVAPRPVSLPLEPEGAVAENPA